MIWTNDPIGDWHTYCQIQEEELSKRQRCDICDEPITDDYCYSINGDYICENCMEDYKVETPVEE